MSVPDTPFLFLGTRDQHQLAGTSSHGKVDPGGAGEPPGGMGLTVQPYDLGKLPVSEASEPEARVARSLNDTMFPNTDLWARARQQP